MPVHSIATFLSYASTSRLLTGAVAVSVLYFIRAYSSGRRNTCERDWAGKMILVVAPPTRPILALLHHLLHLPRPPQILFLPPLPSPLPEHLLTILHTLRLSASKNPLAILHCEALPRTPEGVREFTAKWGAGLKGTVGEGGRRVDAIILGEGWEVVPPPQTTAAAAAGTTRLDKKESGISTAEQDASGRAGASSARKHAETTDTSAKKGETVSRPWSIEQFHFHLLTSLLPALTRAPAERSIRIVTLISPAWRTALSSSNPTTSATGASTHAPRSDLRSKAAGGGGPLAQSAGRGVLTLLLMRHFQLILDTLATAAYGAVEKARRAVPDPETLERGGDGANGPGGGGGGKNREEGLRSNIMAISVVMPWTRKEVVRGVIQAGEGGPALFTYLLLWPLLWLFTPSASRAIDSILFALSAPVRYAPLASTGPSAATTAAAQEAARVSRLSEVAGGDVVQNCQVIDLPPELQEPALARACYDALEQEVEARIKAQSMSASVSASAAGGEGPRSAAGAATAHSLQ